MKNNLSIKRALIFSLLAIIALLASSCDNAWVIAILPDRDKDKIPDYGITLSISGINVGGSAHELTPEAVYYPASVADTVTIANIGKEATGVLSVEISGAESSNFILSADSIDSIGKGGTDSFTIAPITGLDAGNYAATITVSGGNGISAGFTVCFAVGDGSEPYPFSVKDEETLRKVGSDGTDTTYGAWNLSAHYKQTKDIDITGKDEWDPIGSSTTPFQGSYDGNGHFIRGLSINKPYGTQQGFFSFINPTGIVRNLRLIEVDIKGASYLGGIAGEAHGKIEYCEVNGIIAADEDSFHNCIGGISGNNYGTIERCCVSASITGGNYVGGITGANYNDTIENCYVSGNVTGVQSVGGVVGFNTGAMKQSYALGKVAGNDYVGGLVGYLAGATSLAQNCVGLTTQIDANTLAYGRVAGNISGGATITNCFGLAGMTIPPGPHSGEDGTDFSNTGQAAWSAAAHTGPGFDFDTVWEWSSAKNRPILRGLGGQ